MVIYKVLEYASTEVLGALAGNLGKSCACSIGHYDFVTGHTLVQFEEKDENSVIMRCDAANRQDIERTVEFIKSKLERGVVT